MNQHGTSQGFQPLAATSKKFIYLSKYVD